MSFPVYLGIGPWQLHPHAVFEVTAYLVGFRIYLWQRRQLGDALESKARWFIIVAAIVGAGIGSRLLYWLEDPAATLARWRDLPYLLGGKTVVGALVGGLAAVEMTKRRLGIKRRTGDLFAVPLALGIAVGRVGCFLAGLDDRTYGKPSALPWATDFGDGVTRHPVQLYESIYMLAMAAALAWWQRRVHPEGVIFQGLMVGYMSWRLLIDGLKPDLRIIAGLSALQVAALIVLVYYASGFTRSRAQGRAAV
jgi:prolipoprotein diacylglyceryltransferase